MALDFPSPASTGTAYTGTNGIIYIYDGIKWVGQQPNLLGHLLITGQTISGTDVNDDIVLSPNGIGSVSVPSLKIPVGSILSSSVPVVASIADLQLASVIDWSTGTNDSLLTGTYGIDNGIPAPWAAYEFTTNPNPVVQVDDIIAGPGIPALPIPSIILAVCTGTYSNLVIVYSDFSNILPPPPGITVTVARLTTHASMDFSTESITDINLNVGINGKVLVNGSVLPNDTNILDLGSPTKRFRKLWLGGGTIYVLDETLGTDQAIGARDGNLYIAGGAGLNVGEFTLHDNTIKISNPNRNIILGDTTASGTFIINRPVQINTTGSTAAFVVDRTGRTSIRTPFIPPNDVGAFSIIGNQSGIYQPVLNSGGMLHITGNDGVVSRITNDAFGTGAFPAYISRSSRGTVESPSAIQSGDIMSRYSTVGFGTTAFPTGPAATNIEVYARETFTDSSQGTEYRIYTAPVGTTAKSLSLTINDGGLSLANTSNTNAGITFHDFTRQTTAWTGTIVTSQVIDLSSGTVTQIIAGNGITANGISGDPQVGIVGLDTTGVQNIYGTNNQIIVTDAGSSKNFTLSLPQNISTTSSVTFQNITITGNINVIGTSTVANNIILEGKILYLASSATNTEQIDGGGIQLGTSTFAKSILYSNVNNWWDTDGAGLKTLNLVASTSTVDSLIVNYAAHFGSAYENLDFPNAEIQIDSNVNSYSQVVSQNHNTGTNASTDFVATNNIGTDGGYYIDVGINSSAFYNPDYSIMQGNDGYLYINGGNLTIGTQSPGKNILFHTGDTLVENLRATIDDSGLTVEGAVVATTINGLTLPSTTTTAGYVLSNNGVGITSWIQPQTGYVGSTGYIGSQGIQGLSGYTGSRGIQGSTGYTGSQGIQGTSGYTGSIGYTGSQGIQGTTGYTGSYGYTGSQGIQGTTGYTGSYGYTGSQGIQGTTGYTGSYGYTGSQGIQGTTGYTGSYGYTGSQGIQGTSGYTGSIGYTGSQGIQGTTGYTGSYGYTGSIGYVGSIGYTGSASSVAGPLGYAGSIGYTGSTGGVTSLTAGNNIILTTSTGAISITRIDGLQTIITDSTTATYTLLTTDQYFGTNRPSTGACTVTLPLGSTVPVGRQYIIKDESGNAHSAGKNITITRSGSDLIDGSATSVINNNHGATTLMWTGTKWSII